MMNHYLQNNGPPAYPSISPNLQNILQNGNHTQNNQSQQQQQRFIQTNQQPMQQPQQISPTLLNRPRQTHGQFSYSLQEQGNLINSSLNGRTQSLTDLNNNGNHRHQFASSTGEALANQDVADSQFAPNRYITSTGNNSSTFLNQRLLQSYGQQMKQTYERMPAPPSYPGTQQMAAQHSAFNRRMAAPSYQQSMFSNNMGSGSNPPSFQQNRPQQQQHRPQQQQQNVQQQATNAVRPPANSMYSQALMRRLSGQASGNENQVSEQQNRRSFLMQQLQSNRNNSNVGVNATPENNVLRGNPSNENIGNSYQRLGQTRNFVNNQSMTLQTNQAAQNNVEASRRKELSPTPISDKPDDDIESPMSVGSNKSDASASETKIIGSLSLNTSHNSDAFSPISANKDLSPSFTEMLKKIKVDSFELDDEENAENLDSKTSFIDAVLTGMLSEFTGADKTKSGGMGNVDIDLLDLNLFGLLENQENEILDNDSEEENSHIQRSLSLPAKSPKPSAMERQTKKKKTKPRLSRLKSDTTGYSLEARSAAHPYNRLSSVSSDFKTQHAEKPSALKRRHTVTSPASGDRSSIDPHMYFENKNYYKFREQLRNLIQVQVDAGILTPGQVSMKSSRLFLNLLTKRNDWVNESVKAAVKNEKEINMKNFTKRKITIHNDIPPEHIHKFSEVSSEPFQYSNYESNGKTKASDKLMEYLQQQKRNQQQDLKQLPITNLTFSSNNEADKARKSTNPLSADS